MKAAEDIFYETLAIFQRHNHLRMYFAYEDLGDLSYQKSLLAKNEGKKELGNSLQAEALACLKKAHEGMKRIFPKPLLT
jgi:hypothetical protein